MKKDKTITELYNFLKKYTANKKEFITLIKNENHRLLYLIKLLKDENIISDKNVKKLLKMESFPKLAL